MRAARFFSVEVSTMNIVSGSHCVRRLAAFFFAAFANAFATVPLAAQLPQGVTKGATVEGITEYDLANGLRVLIFPDASKPTATINITYLVGSRHEGYGETGMAHLLEHMNFKGTPKHPNIPAELTEHGARDNASTFFDRTNYFETLQATDENVNWALELEADRMLHSNIAKKDLESEMTVVRNEYEAGENSPFNILFERTLSTAYLWHNYGKSTIGARSDIENVPIERLQAFYHKYYQPDNAVLVVAGKVDEAKVLKQIVDRFGPIPKPVRSLDRGNMIYPTYTEEPTQDGEREVSLRRTGDVQVAMALYHVPAGSHPDFAAVDVLTEMLGNTPGGRLYKALVEPKKASEAQAFNIQLKEPSFLVGSATMQKDQSLADARAILIQTMEAAGKTTPSSEDVERAKAALLKETDLELNNSASVGLDLTEWAAAGDWRLIFVHRDRIKKVTPVDVQRVAAAYLKPDNRTVGLFYPTEKPDRAVIPQVTDADIVAMTKDYKGNAALAAGEAFDPSPSNIDARTVRSTLPNGMKLALLSKATRGNTVSARVTVRFGDEKSLANRGTAGTMLASMFDRGSKTMTRQQVKDAFDKLKARVNFGGAGNNSVAIIETTRENLAPTLRLVAQLFKEPAFDAKEFDLLKQEELAGLEQQKSDPQAIAQRLVQKKIALYPKGHPMYPESVEESIASVKAVTVDDVRKFYTDLVGASYGDIAVVGDFSRDSITALTTELFGAWKSPRPFARLVRQYFDAPQASERVETPDKANAFYWAAQNIKVRDDSKDYAALVMGNYIFGGDALSSRLANRIRQKDGLSYGVQSGVGAQSLDSVGVFQEIAIYNPENVARLETAFGEELDRVLKDGFTQDELDKARQGWLQQNLQTRSSDAALVAKFTAQSVTGRTMAFDANFEKMVAALTVADVNAAMKKYIKPAKITAIEAGDFAKHPPKATVKP
jgi:zinc protease